MSYFASLSPIKLFVRFAIPNVVSMAFFSLYYIVSGIFIGTYLGSDLLAGFALIIPFIMMSFALADMIGIGSSVQIAIKLGCGKLKEARQIFSACIVIIFVFSCGVGILEYSLSPMLIDLLDVDERIKESCIECVRVFALFAPFTMLSFALDNYLRICGKTRYSMFVNIFIALSNILLDYLFIVVLGLGLFSAALATCIGLTLGGIFGILPFVLQNLELKFVPIFIRFRTFKNIIYNGSSEFFNNVSSSIYAIFANLALLKIAGVSAVAAFSIITYIDGFITALIIASCDGMQPVLSFNYARKDWHRIKSIIHTMRYFIFIFALVAFSVILFFGDTLVGFFSDKSDEAFIKFGVWALLVFSLNYLITWFNILNGSFLTAFNKPTYSLILSLAQNLFVPLCFLFALTPIIALDGVWLTPFFSECCVIILGVYFLRQVLGREMVSRG